MEHQRVLQWLLRNVTLPNPTMNELRDLFFEANPYIDVPTNPRFWSTLRYEFALVTRFRLVQPAAAPAPQPVAAPAPQHLLPAPAQQHNPVHINVMMPNACAQPNVGQQQSPHSGFPPN